MDNQGFQSFAGADEIHGVFPIGHHHIGIGLRNDYVRKKKAYVS